MHRPTLTNDYWSRVAPGSASEGLALSQMMRVLRRSWAFILVPTLVVAVAAGVFVQTVAPRYTAEAKLLLESRDAAFARNATERDQAAPIDEQGVASQVQVVMSRDIAREAIRRLNLVGNPEFDPTAAEIGPLRRVLMMLGIGANPLERPAEDRVLDAYFERLLVYPAGKSRILTVEFRSGDPELAARAANTIAELYIQSLEAAKVDTARYASTWLGGNIDGLRARVAEAEAKVEAYRAKSGLIGTGGTSNQPLGGQQLGELSSQLSQARTIKADLTARVKLLKEMIKEGRAFEIPDVANNELIRRTVESRMTLRAQLALESRTLLPAHPRIKELSAQLEDLETQIKAAAERIVRTLENDAKIAGARVESLQAAVDGQRDVVAQGNSSEVQLRALEREAKAQREQLESYLARYREAAARDAESATPADARIVSRAVVPEMPSFPKKVPVVGFAAALAFMLSAAAVLGRHLLASPDASARGAPAPDRAETEEAHDRDLLAERSGYPEPMPPGPARERRYGLPAFAAFENAFTANARFPGLAAQDGLLRMPASGLSSAQASGTEGAADDRETDAAEPDAENSPYDLDLLIERLRTVQAEAGRCVLVVETAARAAGAPGLALSLGRTLSARGRTLCVDVSGEASGPDDPGLTDLVAGEAAFLDVIHAQPGSRLHVVRSGSVDREVLMDEPTGLAIGFNAMAQAYDWVIGRLVVRDGEADHSLMSALTVCSDAVVIASDADPEDADLVALYGLAVEAGAILVLVARDHAGGDGAGDQDLAMPLRLSA